jgi:hypothetical protein
MTRPIAPLDSRDCRRLADGVGDEPTWSIMTHALLTGRGRAYLAGELPNFAAAMVFPDYCPDEPQAWGDPEAIWQIASQLKGWTAIEVPCAVAPPLAEIVRTATGHDVKLVDDLFFALNRPPARFEHPAVRMLGLADADLLTAAPRDLSGGDAERSRRMLTEGFYAAAVIDGQIVGRVEAYCRTPRYANLGAVTLAPYRRQGISAAAASIVAAAVLESGQIPLWSTGEPNLASQAVARKLGFEEIARATYVVLA